VAGWVRLSAALALAAFLSACTGRDTPPPARDIAEPPPQSPDLILQQASFERIPDWPFDDHGAALEAFLISCDAIENRNPTGPLSGSPGMGAAGDWQEICRTARGVDPQFARFFFEDWFRPWLATDNGEERGLFTGYYEPLLNGSRTRSAIYFYPLYAPPAMASNLPDRQAIDEGALEGLGLEIFWVDDPITAFFLHIQGSGRVSLPDGSEVRVGYAGQNGHAYYAIGRELIAREEIAREDISLQSIRDWLRANPDQANGVMWTNASYIFFHELDGPGPLGAQGVPLTPGRSLAVDDRFLAYGVPVWLSTTLPGGRAWNRLMVAQDTGGAITGPVRGDIFFGPGAEAEWLAGHMKGEGQYYVLLPNLIGSNLVASLDP